jgi:hypothetical protein
MQAHVDAEVDLVILWVPPACIYDLIRIRGSVHGTIGDAIIDPIVAVVVHPITKRI